VQAIVGGLARGSVDIVVGTHALLSDDVRFRSLGLIVIDEQHRFGVEQRSRLRDQGRERSERGRRPRSPGHDRDAHSPHRRHGALWGPRCLGVGRTPGRTPVIETTWAREDEEIASCWQRVREEVAAGRRAYVICPLVEGSDKIEATSAVEERTRLATHELRGLAVGLLHGQMKSDEKELVMNQFRAGEISPFWSRRW
jgi:ATP-dependent DNA helicase RecG